jgi:hypothetical protein
MSGKHTNWRPDLAGQVPAPTGNPIIDMSLAEFEFLTLGQVSKFTEEQKREAADHFYREACRRESIARSVIAPRASS